MTAWLKFCKDSSISYIHPTLQQVVDFLTHQSNTVGYCAVASARSDLSSFITVAGIKVGEHPLVSRFMSGLFNQKPALPHYTEKWNPQIVLNYLKTFPAVDSMSLKQLTLKLLMVKALLSAQRKKLSLEEMCISPGKYTFYISSLLKQTSAKGGQNRHLCPVLFRSFNLDKRLNVVELLEAYIKRTAPLTKAWNKATADLL